MFPLFGPVPGGMELAVILFIAILMFGVPIALAGGILLTYRHVNSGDTEESELEALRHEVEYLHDEIERLEDDRQNTESNRNENR